MYQGSFRGLADVIRADDFISGDKFLAFAAGEGGVTYSKTDFVYRSGTWRGRPVAGLMSQASKLRGKVLILGHSDIKVSKSTARLLAYTKGIKKIYGTNLQPVPGLSEVLPLGITNNSGESELHDILGNTNHFQIAQALTQDFQNKFNLGIYANFTVSNNTRVRGNLSHILSELPSTYLLNRETPLITNEGRVNYLANLRKMNFVLCPEGNGPDTHRLWETLYMGGVPVVTRSNYLDSIYSLLPVVVLDSWRDLLNPSVLEAKWSEVQKFEWDESLLTQTYWLDKISKCLKNE